MSGGRVGVSARRTGRTSRMLDEAKRLASDGVPVTVIASTQSHANVMRAQCHGFAIEFLSFGCVLNFDWQEMRFRGDHETVVLVDHHVIERKFSRILEMLHRFDCKECDE